MTEPGYRDQGYREGLVQGKLDELTSWKRQVNGDIHEIKTQQTKMAVDIGQLRTKVAVWSAVGGLAGSALVGVAVRFIG